MSGCARNYQHGSARWNARLDPEKVREIRRRSDEKQIALAAEFGTTARNIAHVHHGRTWRQVS